MGVNPKDLYEKKVIKYIKPETPRTYLADFELPNNIIIEAKGRWTLEERKKMMDIDMEIPSIGDFLNISLFSPQTIVLTEKYKTELDKYFIFIIYTFKINEILGMSESDFAPLRLFHQQQQQQQQQEGGQMRRKLKKSTCKKKKIKSKNKTRTK